MTNNQQLPNIFIIVKPKRRNTNVSDLYEQKTNPKLTEEAKWINFEVIHWTTTSNQYVAISFGHLNNYMVISPLEVWNIINVNRIKFTLTQNWKQRIQWWAAQNSISEYPSKGIDTNNLNFAQSSVIETA